MVAAENLDPRTGEERKRRFVTVTRAEKWWAQKARKDPVWFIYYITGKEPALHHRIWLANMFEFDKAKRRYRLNFIAPRESGKTTIVVYAMAWFVSRFPFLTNAIVSVSARQSEARLEMIRELIEHDTRYKNVFPNIHIDERQRNTISQFSVYADASYDEATNSFSSLEYNVWSSLRKRVGSPKDPTLYATGVGGKGIIGSRISGILCLDDIIDDSMLSEALQQETEDYIMRTLIPLLQEHAKAINIGTRWMINDIPERLMKNPEWYTVEIKAILKDENGVPRSYWPSYWPLEKLEKRRLEMNNDTLFRLMYLNDPRASSANRFTLVGLKKPLPKKLPVFQSVFVGTDFSISIKHDADYTVFVAIGVDEDQNYYLLDFQRIRTTPDIMLNELANFCNVTLVNYGRLDKVVIENVAFQSVMQFNIYDKFPHLPIDKQPPVGDKGHRADLLAAKANDGKVFINTESPFYNTFLSECLDFPRAAHDDMLDAVTIVLLYLGRNSSFAKVKQIKSSYFL